VHHHTFCSRLKTHFKAEIQTKICLKMHIFWKNDKTSKPTRCPIAYYYNLVEFVFGADCVLLLSKKNTINRCKNQEFYSRKTSQIQKAYRSFLQEFGTLSNNFIISFLLLFFKV